MKEGRKITDPIIELLAIKLYEHDRLPAQYQPVYDWMRMSEDDREVYRRFARGDEPLRDGWPTPPKD